MFLQSCEAWTLFIYLRFFLGGHVVLKKVEAVRSGSYLSNTWVQYVVRTNIVKIPFRINLYVIFSP